MWAQKRILKVFIIIILVVFLSSTALMSVMYFVDMKSAPSTGEDTGAVLTGQVVTGGVTTGN